MTKEKKDGAKDATQKTKSEKTVQITGQFEQIQTIEELLTAQLAEIQRKKKLADNRSIFLKKRNQLTECMAILNEKLSSNILTTEDFVLRFSERRNYRDEDAIFTISNVDILIKFIIYLQSEISISVDKIEKELLADIG